MSIYIGSDLEDRLKALEIENASLKRYNLEDRLKVLEVENASLKKYNEYHQFVHEIDHMSDLHLDSSSLSNQWILITTLKLRNGMILQ